MGKKDNTKINILTGKRPSLRETRDLKDKGIYKKIVLDVSSYNKFKNMSEEKQKEALKRILKPLNKASKPKKKMKKRVAKKVKNKQEIKTSKGGRSINSILKTLRVARESRKLKNDFDKPLGIALDTESKIKNKNGEILFEVVGIHSRGEGVLDPKLREFHFMVSEETIGYKYLQVGALAKVVTKFGFKRILITKVIKPRSEKRVEEVKQLAHVFEVYNKTWINVLETLESKDIIKDNVKAI